MEVYPIIDYLKYNIKAEQWYDMFRLYIDTYQVKGSHPPS